MLSEKGKINASVGEKRKKWTSIYIGNSGSAPGGGIFFG
jgi:hypothetical protein